MSGLDWAIAAAALLLIIAVNWYFLGPRHAARLVASVASGLADITIRIEGGYSPNAVEVPQGARVRITFDRQEDNPCSEEVVIPDFSIRRSLPAFAKTVIEFTADAPGPHEFKCGMGMLHGLITVK